jgi:hypothetical protein
VQRPVFPRSLLQCPDRPADQALPPRERLAAREAALARRELDWRLVHGVCQANLTALGQWADSYEAAR